MIQVGTTLTARGASAAQPGWGTISQPLTALKYSLPESAHVEWYRF